MEFCDDIHLILKIVWMFKYTNITLSLTLSLYIYIYIFFLLGLLGLACGGHAKTNRSP